MSNDNITLIGMPGAGKSTIGIVLAKVLGYDFIDSDLLIQKEEGKLLWKIMQDAGNEGFTRIEDRVNSQIEARRSVIATGGSVVYCPTAMAHLREISTVIYLKLTYEELESRLGNLVDRGVVLKEGMTLRDLYNERVPCYEKYADITIDETGQTAGETVDHLRRLIEKRFDS